MEPWLRAMFAADEAEACGDADNALALPEPSATVCLGLADEIRRAA